jgi:hypothetical protein
VEKEESSMDPLRCLSSRSMGSEGNGGPAFYGKKQAPMPEDQCRNKALSQYLVNCLELWELPPSCIWFSAGQEDYLSPNPVDHSITSVFSLPQGDQVPGRV